MPLLRNKDTEDDVALFEATALLKNSGEKSKPEAQKDPPKTRERFQWQGQSRAERPMDYYLADMLGRLENNQVIVVQAETGVGKTSRIPQALRQAHPDKKVLLTQPTRTATDMNARYIAQEMGARLGSEEIDFSLKNERQANEKSQIELMVDQTLVNRIVRAGKLPDGFLVVDEAHTRSINIDLLLFLIKLYLPKSPNTKVVITSATIDTAKFEKYFRSTSKGKEIAVAESLIAYNPTLKRIITKERKLQKFEHHSQAATSESLRIMDLFAAGNLTRPGELEGDPEIPVSEGTVLVFLPGKEDIRAAHNQVTQYAHKNGLTHNFELLESYRGQARSERNKIDAPLQKGKLRVIFTTEILKASVTPPQTVCVIDSLQVKRKIENKDGISKLEKVTQSGAEADQARGRTGRECTGWYIPISFESEYATITNKYNSEYWPQPAILREGIITIALTIAAIGKDIRTVDLIDKPDKEKIDAAIERLKNIDALHADGSITEFGRKLLHFSTSPENARSIFRSEELGVLPEQLIVTAINQAENIFDYPNSEYSVVVERSFLNETIAKNILQLFIERGYAEVSNAALANILTPQALKEQLKQTFANSVCGVHTFEGIQDCMNAFSKEYPGGAPNGISYQKYLEFAQHLHIKISEDPTDQAHAYESLFLIAHYSDSLSKFCTKAKDDPEFHSKWQVNSAAELTQKWQVFQKEYHTWCALHQIPSFEVSLKEEDVTMLQYPCSIPSKIENIAKSILIRDSGSTLSKKTSTLPQRFFGINHEDPTHAKIQAIRYEASGEAAVMRSSYGINKSFVLDLLFPDADGKSAKAILRSVIEQKTSKFFGHTKPDGSIEQVKSDLLASIKAYRAFHAQTKVIKLEYAQLAKTTNKIPSPEQYLETKLRLWCASNGINYVSIEQAKSNLNSLMQDLKEARIECAEDPRMEREFDWRKLSRSVLAGMVHNIVIAGKNISGFNVYAPKLVSESGWGFPYVYGLIHKDEVVTLVRRREEKRTNYFSSLCIPIELSWLLEENPHLCTKKANVQTIITHSDGTIMAETTHAYLGMEYKSAYEPLSLEDRTKYFADRLLNYTNKQVHPSVAEIKRIRYEISYFFSQVQKDPAIKTLIAENLRTWIEKLCATCNTEEDFFKIDFVPKQADLHEILDSYAPEFFEAFSDRPVEKITIGQIDFPIAGHTLFNDKPSIVLSASVADIMQIRQSEVPALKHYAILLDGSGTYGNSHHHETLAPDSLEELKQKLQKEELVAAWKQHVANNKELGYVDGKVTYSKGGEFYASAFVVEQGSELPALPESIQWGDQPNWRYAFAYSVRNKPNKAGEQSSWHLLAFPTQVEAHAAQLKQEEEWQLVQQLYAEYNSAETLKETLATELEYITQLGKKVTEALVKQGFAAFDITSEEWYVQYLAYNTTVSENNFTLIYTKIVPELLAQGDYDSLKKAESILAQWREKLENLNAQTATRAQKLAEKIGHALTGSEIVFEGGTVVLVETQRWREPKHAFAVRKGYQGEIHVQVQEVEEDGTYVPSRWMRYKGFQSSMIAGPFESYQAAKRALLNFCKTAFGESWQQLEPPVVLEHLGTLAEESVLTNNTANGRTNSRTQRAGVGNGRRSLWHGEEEDEPAARPAEKPPALRMLDFIAAGDKPLEELYIIIESGLGTKSEMDKARWRAALAQLLARDDGIFLQRLFSLPWGKSGGEDDLKHPKVWLQKAINERTNSGGFNAGLEKSCARAQQMLELFPQLCMFYRTNAVKELLEDYIGEATNTRQERAAFLRSLINTLVTQGIEALPSTTDAEALEEFIVELVDRM